MTSRHDGSAPRQAAGPTGRTPLRVDAAHFSRYVPQGLSPSECWPWRGYVGSGGYGIYTSATESRHVKAHRAAWAARFGDPGSACVLHRCDTPACVNPSHLFIGTQLANIADMVAKRRHNSGTRALSLEQAIAIRKEAISYEKRIAKKYGISRGIVTDIVRGKTWRHAP